MELRDKDGLTEAEFLAAYRPGDYPHPSVTADVLVFDRQGDALRLLLIRRGGHPYLGCWALPGGFSNPDENVDACAARELEEETHLTGQTLVPVGFFSDPGRDPRCWTMTRAYMTLVEGETPQPQADDDAQAADWFTVTARRAGDELHIRLTNGEEALTARLRVAEQRTAAGVALSVAILEQEGLAFDHGKIIATALLRLEQNGVTIC
ncbi:MAG: NUDIX hydrolase [Clostridiales bacterium]|nr:NUDIX hydrolase [Clostridiales bacterium]